MVNDLPEYRIEMITNLDVEKMKSYQQLLTGVRPTCDRTVLTGLHKARCILARRGLVSIELGNESADWLIERGMHPDPRVIN